MQRFYHVRSAQKLAALPERADIASWYAPCAASRGSYAFMLNRWRIFDAQYRQDMSVETVIQRVPIPF